MAGYGDDTAFATWLADNGHALPENAPTPAILRQRGSVYLDGLYGPKFIGVAAGGFSQDRAWPRIGAEAFGEAIPSDLVPIAIEQASYHAALYEAQNPGGLSTAASQAGTVKRRKLDVLETEFFEGSGDALGDATVRLSSVEGLIAPFMTVSLPAVFVV